MDIHDLKGLLIPTGIYPRTETTHILRDLSIGRVTVEYKLLLGGMKLVFNHYFHIHNGFIIDDNYCSTSIQDATGLTILDDSESITGCLFNYYQRDLVAYSKLFNYTLPLTLSE